MQNQTLKDVKAGDRVMSIRNAPVVNGRTASPRFVFYTVTKVTEKRIYVGMREYDRESGRPRANALGWSWIAVVSKEALEWEAEQKRKNEEAKQENEAYDARLDVQITRRLSNMDHEAWLGLGLPRLQQINALIDAPIASEVKQESKCSRCNDTTGICECW